MAKRKRRAASRKKKAAVPSRCLGIRDAPKQPAGDPAAARPVPESASAPVPAGAAPLEEPKRKRGYVYRDVRALMRAIFRRKNAVDVAAGLLETGSDATKAKIFSQCLEYLYGKPVQQIETRSSSEGSVPFQFVTHIPRPEYPAPAPNATDSSGTLHTTQEDEHE